MDWLEKRVTATAIIRVLVNEKNTENLVFKYNNYQMNTYFLAFFLKKRDTNFVLSLS